MLFQMVSFLLVVVGVTWRCVSFDGIWRVNVSIEMQLILLKINKRLLFVGFMSRIMYYFYHHHQKTKQNNVMTLPPVSPDMAVIGSGPSSMGTKRLQRECIQLQKVWSLFFKLFCCSISNFQL